jgi:hypothetical protein
MGGTVALCNENLVDSEYLPPVMTYPPFFSIWNLTCIREVLDSNLGCNISYFPQSL